MESNAKSGQNIVVTGANKGIGYAIAKGLIEIWKKDYENNQEYNFCNLILAARNMDQLNQAKESLIETNYPIEKIYTIKLDLLDDQSVKDFVSEVKQKFQKVDMLINNAGIMYPGNLVNEEVIKRTLKTNYYSTVKICSMFLIENDMLAQNGKVVNVSSGLGRISRIKKNEEIKTTLSNYDNISFDNQKKVVDSYESEIRDNVLRKKWPTSVYAMSKLFLSVWTKIIIRQNFVQEKNIQVYSCCPGWCKTDLTAGSKAPRSAEDGASVITDLYLLPWNIQSNQGGFYKEGFWKSIDHE